MAASPMRGLCLEWASCSVITFGLCWRRLAECEQGRRGGMGLDPVSCEMDNVLRSVLLGLSKAWVVSKDVTVMKGTN